MATTGSAPVPAAFQHRPSFDLARNPMLVYWEMTQACGLACKHCRAEAVLRSHPLQLDRRESSRLLRQIAGFGDPVPHLILTGGDPLQREDLFDIIAEARGLGIGVSITPAATPKLTAEVIARLKAHGIQALGLSLDGSDALRHEGVRGVPGCFQWTLDAARAAGEAGLPIQVNTLVSEETADDLPAIYELLQTFPVMRWSLFFLIAVGRGRALQEVSPERGERLMDRVHDLAQKAPFAIKTTEAPSYRRISLERTRQSGRHASAIQQDPVYNGFSIRDGHGIVFVSHIGEVYPSGFLPLRVGNIRTQELSALYRDSNEFRALHQPDLFRGKCGRCEYRHICGGSRARAYAHTGDPLASDPLCPYQPQG
jgi:radical SAM protein